MATIEPDDLTRSDRRSLYRRLDMLELRYTELHAIVQRVELEQAHVRSVLDSRFDALSKGQELLIEKFDRFREIITLQFEDAEKSAAGRSVLTELHRMNDTLRVQDGQIEELIKTRNEADGALYIIKWLVGTSGIASIAALIRSFFAK